MYVAATPSKEEKMFLWPEAFSDFHPKEQSLTEGVPVAA